MRKAVIIAGLAIWSIVGFASAASAHDGGCFDRYGRPVYPGPNVVCTPDGPRNVGPDYYAYNGQAPYYGDGYAYRRPDPGAAITLGIIGGVAAAIASHAWHQHHGPYRYR